MAVAFPHFASFSVAEDPHTAGARWKKWLFRFQNYLSAFAITEEERKRALLLHFVGEEVLDIFEGLPNTGGAAEYKEAVDALNNYFVPKLNREYEILLFRQATQERGESIDKYHTRLRKLASQCAFANTDAEIKLQIIQTCHSRTLKEKALMKPQLTLEELINMARMMDLVTSQSAQLNSSNGNEYKYENTEIAAISTKGRGQIAKTDRGFRQQATYQRSETKLCYRCGREFPHRGGKDSCTALKANCRFCGIRGHFERCCRRKLHEGKADTEPTGIPTKNTSKAEIRCIGNADSQDNVAIFAMHICDKLTGEGHRLFYDININNCEIRMLLDTGAAVNLLQEKDWRSISPIPKLKETNLPIMAFASSQPLAILGTFNGEISHGNDTISSDFYVLKDMGQKGHSLLGCHTCLALKIVQVNEVHTVNLAYLKNKFSKTFQGLGKMVGDPITLKIKEGATPLKQPHRRIPYHLRPAVEKEINCLLEQDVIEKHTGTTSWLTPLVVVPKKGKSDEVRICLDMRANNECLVRERHEIPMLEDILQKISGAKYFSRIDLKKSYHQMELDEASRLLTVFETHEGVYRYKRLFFGVSSASEIFQNTMQRNLSDINNSESIIDDILVYGSTQRQHDEALLATFQKLDELNVTVNEEKCDINVPELIFFGWHISAAGITPTEDRLEAILKTSRPKDNKELRSFLGSTGYLLKFVPHYAEMVEPLRLLLRKGVKWSWTAIQTQAYNKLINCITNSPVLQFFNPARETVLWVDASPVGIGAVLLQDDEDSEGLKPISFASRTLTDTERRYAQVEREMLAVSWGCQRFRMYLLGKKFVIYTDNLPIVHIIKNPGKMPSPRIERLIFKIQGFDFEIQYRAGCTNIADYISRHPIPRLPVENTLKSSAEIHAVSRMRDNIPIAMTIEQVQQGATQDAVYRHIIEQLEQGKSLSENRLWSDEEKKRFSQMKKVESDLSQNSGLIMIGGKLCLPKGLEEQALLLAHKGHQGEERTKQLLRTKVWFPNLSMKVKHMITNCQWCQITGKYPKPEPLQILPPPERVWQNIAVDFCGPMRNGQYLLVILDELSRFPIIHVVSSTKASVTLQVLRNVFGIFGNAEVIKSDNGPPFSSAEFAQEMKATPYWPQANGSVERLNQPIKKVLQIAEAQGKDWRLELETWLKNYRATPHCVTKESPFELMFMRKMGNDLPIFDQQREISKDEYDQKRAMSLLCEKKNKDEGKVYADRKRGSKYRDIKVGDHVWVKRKCTRKEDSKFTPLLWTVTAVKGSMITAESNGRSICRNISFFKRFIGDPTRVGKRENTQAERDWEWIFDENEPHEQACQNDIPEQPCQNEVPEPRYPRRIRRPVRRFIEEM